MAELTCRELLAEAWGWMTHRADCRRIRGWKPIIRIEPDPRCVKCRVETFLAEHTA